MGYIQEIRSVIGNRPIIVVGASVLLQNEDGCLLLVHRSDNKLWGLPAGTLELGESLEDCARRELEEETGLQAIELNFYRVFSGPQMFHRYSNGDEVYIVSVAFRCSRYNGLPRVNDAESLSVQFFELQKLPDHMNPPSLQLIRKFIEEQQ